MSISTYPVIECSRILWVRCVQCQRTERAYELPMRPGEAEQGFESRFIRPDPYWINKKLTAPDGRTFGKLFCCDSCLEDFLDAHPGLELEQVP